ncbi:hypothetical protein THOE12_50207 [Vibrio rotiferianus]|nr:hypothetical protein THOE12_50207 [Vibrio rotiferianus]
MILTNYTENITQKHDIVRPNNIASKMAIIQTGLSGLLKNLRLCNKHARYQSSKLDI